jgi:hypothetical protein
LEGRDTEIKVRKRLAALGTERLPWFDKNGREDEIEGVRVPRYEPGPPETLTDTDYANLLRVPDRRTLASKRDYALLRVLGDCGLRPAELRGLRARDLNRSRKKPSRRRGAPEPSIQAHHPQPDRQPSRSSPVVIAPNDTGSTAAHQPPKTPTIPTRPSQR